MDQKHSLFDTAAAKTLERIGKDHEQAPPRLQPILAYIEEHLFEPDLDFQQLKRACQLRDNTLPIQFHKAVGLPPYAYIKDCRMETAARLLRDTDLKIWQVCTLVGYSGIQVFSRAFLQWSGLRPTAYRRKHQLANPDAPRSSQEANPTERLEISQQIAENELLLKKAVQGTLGIDKAEALIQHLLTLYPSAIRTSQPATEDSAQESPNLPTSPGSQQLDERTLEEIHAEALWSSLRERPHDDQKQFIGSLSNLEGPGFCHLLRQKSLEAGRGDRKLGVHLAELALLSIDAIDPRYLDPRQHALLESQAWTTLGNARRLNWDLNGAAKDLARADQLLPAEDRGALPEAVLTMNKAGLLFFQQRPVEALELMDRVLPIFKQADAPQELAQASLMRAQLQQDMALVYEDLHRALALIDVKKDPFLKLTTYHNMALALARLGRLPEALELLPPARALATATSNHGMLLHLKWVEGVIADRSNQISLAEVRYEETRDGFLDLGRAGEAATVSLDLAILYAKQQRSAEVVAMVAQVIPLFDALKIHPQALVSLTLLKQALRSEQISLRGLQRIRSLAEGLQNSPRRQAAS